MRNKGFYFFFDWDIFYRSKKCLVVKKVRHWVWNQGKCSSSGLNQHLLFSWLKKHRCLPESHVLVKISAIWSTLDSLPCLFFFFFAFLSVECLTGYSTNLKNNPDTLCISPWVRSILHFTAKQCLLFFSPHRFSKRIPRASTAVTFQEYLPTDVWNSC